MLHSRLVAAAGAFGLLAAAVTSATAQQQLRSVTLRDALRLSAQFSPGVAVANGQVRSAALDIRQQKLQYLPQLQISPTSELDLSSGQSRVDPVTGQVISGNTSNLTYGLSVSASYLLFDGFQRSHNIRAAEAGESAATAQLVSTRFENVLETTGAFLSALSDQQLVAAQQANVTLAERQYRVAAAKVNAGSGGVTDSLGARVALNSARVGLLQAQTGLAADEAALGRLVGVAGRVAAVDDSSLYRTAPLDTAAILSMAVDSAPAVVSARAATVQARANYQAQKSLYWPTLALSASSNWASQELNNYNLTAFRQLRLFLSFNPWTNLDRETAVTKDRIQLDDAEVALADARRNIVAELEQQFAQAAVAQSELELDSVSVSSARLDANIRSSQYALGSTDIVALLQTQQNLNSAEISMIGARYAYLRAVATIQSILGRTLLDEALQPGQ